MIKAFNCFEEDLRLQDTLFVVLDRDQYDALKIYSNVVFLNEKEVYKAINICGKQCRWLFVHNICTPRNGLKIKKEIRHKIIWRTWGSDIGYNVSSGNVLKKTVKKAIMYFWKKVVYSFYGVGIANLVDKINITEKYGELKTFRLPYLSRENYDNFHNVNNELNSNDYDTRNVLIGHSGYPNDNHVEILKKLEKFKGKIKIYIPISYGNPQYIETVKKYVDQNWKEEAILIEEFLEYDKYIKLLSKIDVAIFDWNGSYALGNLALLFSFKKKIFVNSKGVIHKALVLDKMPHETTDRIDDMSIEEFFEPVDYGEKPYEFFVKSFEENLGCWISLYSELDNVEKISK